MKLTYDTSEHGNFNIVEYVDGKFHHLRNTIVDESVDSHTFNLPDDFKGAVVRNVIGQLTDDSQAEKKQALMDAVTLIGIDSSGMADESPSETWYQLPNGRVEHCAYHVENAEEELKMKAFAPNSMPIDPEKYLVSENPEQRLYKMPSFHLMSEASHWVITDQKANVIVNERGVDERQPFLEIDESGGFNISKHPTPERAYLIARAVDRDGVEGFAGVRVSDDESRCALSAPVVPSETAYGSLSQLCYESGWRSDMGETFAVIGHTHEEDGSPVVVMGSPSNLEMFDPDELSDRDSMVPVTLTRNELIAQIPDGEKMLENYKGEPAIIDKAEANLESKHLLEDADLSEMDSRDMEDKNPSFS